MCIFEVKPRGELGNKSSLSSELPLCIKQVFLCLTVQDCSRFLHFFPSSHFVRNLCTSRPHVHFFFRYSVGPSLQAFQVDMYHSPSSSRSHSPARTDSTSGSRPTSGTPREDLNEINKVKINTARDEKRTASDDRAGTASRIRSLANRRKTPTFSSDSTLSSDSDIERNGQRTSGPRHRRGHPASSRTKEHSINTTGSRQNVHRQPPAGGNRAKKTVSWSESPREANTTNVNRQIPNERPRVPPKPPARTASRDTGVVGYVQVTRNTASRHGVNRTVNRGVVTDVIAQKPVNPMAVSSVCEHFISMNNQGERIQLFSVIKY